MTRALSWQHIAHLDAFLAGSIACRGHEWYDDTTAEQEADSVGLIDGPRADFLRGWYDELAEREEGRRGQLVREYEAMAKGHEKGDPAGR